MEDVEKKQPRATHGCGTKYIGEDGIQRALGLTRFDNGTTQFSIETYWDGVDAEPTRTAFRVGNEAIGAITEMLATFSMDMGRFKLPETPNV